MTQYKLRPYQERGRDDILNFFDKEGGNKRGIVIAPTGAGKSLYIAAAADAIQDPLVILQPSKELLIQNYEKYISYGNEASIFSASLKQKELGHVTFATPGSIIKSISKLKDMNVRKLLIDESHLGTRVGSQTANLIKGLHKDTKVVGLTATPVLLRNGMYGAELSMLNRTRDSIFNSIIHVTQIQEVVAGGFWSPIVYEIYKQKEDALTENSNGSDFTEDSLNKYFFDNKLEDQVLDIVERIKGERKSILIFTPSIAAAAALCSKIPGSQYVYSGMSDTLRDGIIKAFKSGIIQTVINVNILGVGFDHPELSAVIETRPTMSMAIYYQHLGRGVRIHPNKKDFLICDLSGNFDRFGKIENLSFEDLPGYGWGMFSGDYLLSGHPIKAARVTRESVIKAAIEKDNTVLWFGKHKGWALDKIPVEYFKWMLSPEAEFEFKSHKMKELETKIRKLIAI